jgi:hypothetical protein
MLSVGAMGVDMKALKIGVLFLLAWLGLGSVGADRAEAFGWYRANDPVRVDHCYRGPAYDYMAPYYSSRGQYRGGCHKHCCEGPYRSHTSRARITPLK